MRIIKGRGNNRRVVITVPHASIVKRSPESEQKQFAGVLCDILGVK